MIEMESPMLSSSAPSLAPERLVWAAATMGMPRVRAFCLRSWVISVSVCHIEDPRDWVLHYQARLLGLQSGFDRLLCLPLVRGVRRYEYQETTALRVLREMRGRAILADEVGLGKTIEAGIVLKELIVRGLARKVLVLTPASLVTQWREELDVKFGLRFEIMDEFEDWARHDLVISSIDTAKRDVHKDEIQRLSYDVVIVDEAHKLKNRATKNWRLVASIRKRYMLLLTATPVQNELEELFNLVTLLRPGQLSSYGGFRSRFVRRTHLCI